MQLNASFCIAKAHQTLVLVPHSHQRKRHRRWGSAPGSDYTERGKGSSIVPLVLVEPEGRPSVHTQRQTVCQLRVEPPSSHHRAPAATPMIFTHASSFVQQSVNQANAMRKLNLSCCSYRTLSLSARLPV
jgi:hypothetical protein